MVIFVMFLAVFVVTLDIVVLVVLALYNALGVTMLGFVAFVVNFSNYRA